MDAEEKSGYIMGTYWIVKGLFFKILDNPEILKIEITSLGSHKDGIG
jgi:hypothetical protein